MTSWRKTRRPPSYSSYSGAKLIQVLDQSERAQRPTAREFAAMGPVPDSGNAVAQGTGPRVAMVTAKGAYLIELPEGDLDAQFGDLFGSDRTAPDGSSNGRGWSDGVDNRTLLGTAVHRHGQVWGAPGACSGALIGARIVRTAAHCLVTHSLTSGGVVPTANGQSFNYRQNGGGSQVNATSQTAFFGGGYISNNCGLRTAMDYWSGYRANFDTCTWQDWAYIILPSNWRS